MLECWRFNENVEGAKDVGNPQNVAEVLVKYAVHRSLFRYFSRTLLNSAKNIPALSGARVSILS